MCDSFQDPIHNTDNTELVSVRRTASLTYVNAGFDLCQQAESNHVRDAYVVTVKDDQETDRNSISSSSPRKPLTGSPSNQRQLQALKDTISRVSSLVAKQQSLKGKTSLPGGDPKDSWQGTEHYLREKLKDTDPESLTTHKKPFYKRTWFACITYCLILLLLVAAILTIASNRAVIIPTTLIKGQILSVATPLAAADRSQSDVTTSKPLISDSTTPIVTSKTAGLLNDNLSLPFMDATTVQPNYASAPSIPQLPPSVARLLLGNPTPVPTESLGQKFPEPVATLLKDATSSEVS